jgi:hypothetical protein
LTSQAKLYRYSAANLTAIETQPALDTNNNGLVAAFPANSITLIELDKGTDPIPTPTPVVNVTSRLYLPVVTRR